MIITSPPSKIPVFILMALRKMLQLSLKKKKRFMGSNVYGAFNEKKYIYNVLKGHYIIIITIRECL